MSSITRWTSVLRQEDGPLTRDLLRSPGRFGLGQVPAEVAPDRTTGLVCGFCATGCALDVHLKDGRAVNLTPSVDYPVNRGMACPKGWESLTPLNGPDRATQPLLRKGGELVPVGWEEAARVFATRFRSLYESGGGDSLAYLSTGQIPSEEMVFLGALAKFGIGMHHGDGNTRQCMATAVTAYKESFGFDAPPYTYADFEASDVIVLVGSNLCIAHPILWERILANPDRPQIIVVDPRRTETAMAATQHVQLRPRSDLALFYGVAKTLLRRGWTDTAFIDQHTSGLGDFSAFLDTCSLPEAAATTGIPTSAIETLAETIHRGKRVSFWWTMGVNQGHEAVRIAQSLINLALLTGNIGRPGTGANSITGQCNAMGSRMFSNTTSLFCGRSFEDADDRRAVSEIIGVPDRVIPRVGSLAYDEIIEGAESGRIRGLWIVATNSAHSWIDRKQLDRALGRLDFLVVQDMYGNTETTDYADLVLPAAGWGEKEGTFINSERRVGLIKQVRRPPGQALSDFRIFRLLADALDLGEPYSSWRSPEDVFRLMQRLSHGRPCDISGIGGYRELDRCGGIQWPAPTGVEGLENERRLFEDGRFYHSDGRARFVWEAPRPLPEPTCDKFPLVLLTGRGSSSQWHTQTRTAKSGVLRSLSREGPYIELSPEDASRFGVTSGDAVAVRSRRSQVTARALVTATVRAGQVFMPMHDVVTNELTFPAFDPYSRQPAYKHCAVRVELASVGGSIEEATWRTN